MTVASQALGATLILMSETLLFTVTKEGMEPVKNIWWCISRTTRPLPVGGDDEQSIVENLRRGVTMGHGLPTHSTPTPWGWRLARWPLTWGRFQSGKSRGWESLFHVR